MRPQRETAAGSCGAQWFTCRWGPRGSGCRSTEGPVELAPQLWPAELRWPMIREALANRTANHLVGLAARRRRRNWLAEHPEVVKGRLAFTGRSTSAGNGSLQLGMTRP